ncbi:MAG: outer membrane beta-barrel protein [Candidatus Devosia phytovorans]|uniref:Outer membrane beta-barrel protein n=1 Tax=Candidatus Devosia phytovorans TaxID=3121372 RepID=A0AAJ5VV98_9HYPH|nr:outer membrane beta-barrel protein [Devosia sp.]WEK04780.1 MAG: outer membrane beta-barrel protein [Devosia sp.]
MAGRAALACALCVAGPVLAASDHSLGDGSKTDNARLLPDVYPGDPVLVDGSAGGEPYDPFLDVDWSVALRGTYTKGTDGERFDTYLVPSVSLEHTGTRSALRFDGSAEVVRPDEGNEIDISALRLGLDTAYQLDSATRITGSGNLSVTRAVPGTPGLASDVVEASRTVSGGGTVGITREFGKFNLSLTGGAQRTTYGPTTYADGLVRDNSVDDYWALDSGLRVGFQVTPIFEVFGQATVGRDMFDNDSPSLGVSMDAADYTLRAGVTGRWNEVLEVTGSAGLGLRKFDVADLGEVVTQLYDAQLIYTPDPTWRFTAGFATTVTPPGPTGSGVVRVDHTATAEVGYTVNSWLALRALADWNMARFEGSDNEETGHGFALGADYTVNAHTAVSADYGYDYSDSTSYGVQDAHRVTMGVTIAR